jgi:hypothetical protein
MAALLNSLTSKGPLNRAHTYKAAVVTTARPDATPHHGDEDQRAGRDRCFDDGNSRRHDVRRPTRHASEGTRFSGWRSSPARESVVYRDREIIRRREPSG